MVIFYDGDTGYDDDNDDNGHKDDKGMDDKMIPTTNIMRISSILSLVGSIMMHDDNDDDDDNGNDNDDDDDDDPSHQSYLLPARSLHIQTQLEILAAFPPVVEIY